MSTTEHDVYASPSETSEGRVFTVTGQDWDSITDSLGEHADSIRRAPDFPKESFLAVTDTTLYAFAAKGGFSWKVKEQLGAWPLGSFRAEREDHKVNVVLKLDFGDGEGQELETMTTMANARNVEVVERLVAAPQPSADG